MAKLKSKKKGKQRNQSLVRLTPGNNLKKPNNLL